MTTHHEMSIATTINQSSIFDKANQEMLNCDGVTPTTQDILMGRGNSHKNHPGNIIFQGKFKWRHRTIRFLMGGNLTSLLRFPFDPSCVSILPIGLVKTYRKQYFQVDTLINKRTTIVEIIHQCHRNGARFLEQKQSTSGTDNKSKGSSSSDEKDMIWTVLTKERTFRKVSLAIQYRQRCNASSNGSEDSGPVSPTNPITAPSSMHFSSNTNHVVSPSDVRSYMDHHSNHDHNDTHQPFMYGYHHPHQNRPSSMSQNRTMSTSISAYGYSHVATTSNAASPNLEKKPPTHASQFDISDGMVVPNHDKMKVTTDEFKSRYEDSMHWMNSASSNHVANGAPWSLPFLSNAMSALPPIQSSIHLRQRNEMIPMNHPHYSNHTSTNNNMKFMAQKQGCYGNTDTLYVPSTRPQYDDCNGGDEDLDPIPISAIFAEPKSNRNWDAPNVPQYGNSMHAPQSYGYCVSPQESRPRRVSNFNELDHDDHQRNGRNNHTGHDEIASTSGSITTIRTTDLKEFHQIDHDTSDTLTTIVSRDNEDADSVVVIADSDDTDEEDCHPTKHHHTEYFEKSVDVSDDSSCSDGSILYNDLCLSPFSFSAHSFDVNENDCNHHNSNHMNELQQLQLPFL